MGKYPLRHSLTWRGHRIEARQILLRRHVRRAASSAAFRPQLLRYLFLLCRRVRHKATGPHHVPTKQLVRPQTLAVPLLPPQSSLRSPTKLARPFLTSSGAISRVNRTASPLPFQTWGERVHRGCVCCCLYVVKQIARYYSIIIGIRTTCSSIGGVRRWRKLAAAYSVASHPIAGADGDSYLVETIYVGISRAVGLESILPIADVGGVCGWKE